MQSQRRGADFRIRLYYHEYMRALHCLWGDHHQPSCNGIRIKNRSWAFQPLRYLHPLSSSHVGMLELSLQDFAFLQVQWCCRVSKQTQHVRRVQNSDADSVCWRSRKQCIDSGLVGSFGRCSSRELQRTCTGCTRSLRLVCGCGVEPGLAVALGIAILAPRMLDCPHHKALGLVVGHGSYGPRQLGHACLVSHGGQPLRQCSDARWLPARSHAQIDIQLLGYPRQAFLNGHRLQLPLQFTALVPKARKLFALLWHDAGALPFIGILLNPRVPCRQVQHGLHVLSAWHQKAHTPMEQFMENDQPHVQVRAHARLEHIDIPTPEGNARCHYFRRHDESDISGAAHGLDWWRTSNPRKSLLDHLVDAFKRKLRLGER